jgi:uncharacterized NAD(P)/FAD-binding protein YdhS
MKNDRGKSAAIIGGGFCGMMTALHLAEKAAGPITIHIINEGYPFGRGVAYNTRSNALLLNVPVARMSAFPDQPEDFLNWLAKKEPFSNIDREILGKMYVPRHEYGEYLGHTWKSAQAKLKPGVKINLVNGRAVDVIPNGDAHEIVLANGEKLTASYVVLATGNEKPSDPAIKNTEFFKSPDYFKNSWDERVAKDLPEGNVLIIGNGLTMVDTTLELLNNGCHGTIYSLSPNGFTILPHRHNGLVYTKLREELKEPYELNTLFRLFRKHIDFVRQFGLSAEPVVDSIRDISQKIWIGMSIVEKKRFMMHLRHLWGLARHRLPLHIHDHIKDMKRKGKLVVFKGRLRDIVQDGNAIRVEFYNRTEKETQFITVSRVINCTGPLTDITKSPNELLRNLVQKGIIRPDELKLGVDTNLQGAVIDRSGATSESIFTLGGNLRGLLWETTAVPELRVQAEKLAEHILEKISDPGKVEKQVASRG